MFRTTRRSTFAVGCLSLIGCGWFGGGDDAASTTPEATATTAGSDSAAPAISAAEPEPSVPLRLQLRVGDRFPLLKTVEQTLTQATPGGPATSTSRLELLLAIHVEEIAADGRQRLGVQYHRVRYGHDVAGERIDYDSETIRGPVPPAVQPYHGLARNGFSFWLGPDCRIVELVGFPAFLERCVRDVPVAQRQRLLSLLAETSGEEGIANFIDDSVGLLPSRSKRDATSAAESAPVRVGESWIREQRFLQPVPVFVSSRCTLKGIDDETAEIDIVGTIAASTPFMPAHSVAPGTTVTVRGGNEFGSCIVRRATGLPVESRVERFFDMSVRTAAGETVEQRKRVVTTIRTFPEQAAVQTAAAPASAPR